MDHISRLPNELRARILSLIDLKEAMRTAAVSKAWKDTWKLSRMSLEFDPELIYSRRGRVIGFRDFVNYVLRVRDPLDDLHRLTIISRIDDVPGSIVNGCLQYAMTRHLRQLHLNILWSDSILLPTSLFNLATLTSLVLLLGDGNEQRWIIPDYGSISLPNLKILHIGHAVFVDTNLANRFFSSCRTSLEELCMVDIELQGIELVLSYPRLSTFTLNNLGFGTAGRSLWLNSSLNLDAPCLTSIIRRDYLSRDCTLKVPCLQNALMGMRAEESSDDGAYLPLPWERRLDYADRMRNCLQSLIQAHDLKLSAWFLEVFTEGFAPIKLYALKCLQLEIWFTGESIQAIACLLKLSPNVESLVLGIKGYVLGNADVPEDFLLEKLVSIEIKGATGNGTELNLLKALLKKATDLKKLVVYTTKQSGLVVLRDFSKKLLMLPRTSSTVMISIFSE